MRGKSRNDQRSINIKSNSSKPWRNKEMDSSELVVLRCTSYPKSGSLFHRLLRSYRAERTEWSWNLRTRKLGSRYRLLRLRRARNCGNGLAYSYVTHTGSHTIVNYRLGTSCDFVLTHQNSGRTPLTRFLGSLVKVSQQVAELSQLLFTSVWVEQQVGVSHTDPPW